MALARQAAAAFWGWLRRNGVFCGLLFQLGGAVTITSAVIVSEPEAVELGGVSRFAGSDEENLRLPAVQDRLRQARWARHGLIAVVVGTLLQLFGTWPSRSSPSSGEQMMTTSPPRTATSAGCGDYSLACKSCLDKHRKWRGWIEKIREEVKWCVHDHHVFRATVEMMERVNVPELDATFYKWLGHSYQEAVSLRIRRLLDTNKNTYSLAVLLQEIAENCRVLSRERFISLYETEDQDLIDIGPAKTFDDLAGIGAAYFPADQARNDLASVQSLAQRVKDTADTRFAHYDRRQRAEVSTWGEVDRCVDKLANLARRYSLLVDGIPVRDKKPPGGWMNVFRFPWKPDEPGEGGAV